MTHFITLVYIFSGCFCFQLVVSLKVRNDILPSNTCFILGVIFLPPTIVVRKDAWYGFSILEFAKSCFVA